MVPIGGRLSIKLAARLMAWCVFFNLLCFVSSAQSTTPPDSASSPQAPKQGQGTPSIQPEPKPAEQAPKTEEHGKPAVNQSGTSKDRLFYALPNFLSMENGGKLPPLTSKQKFA